MSLNLDRSGWVRLSLGTVATASKEKVNPSDGTVDRYVAGEHLDSDDLKIHRWGDPNEIDLGPAFHRRFRSGQVLYGSRRTYLRKVAVADFDGVCANTTFVVQTKDPARLLPEFLPFVMSAEPFHAFAIAESKGSVNPYVNWSDIERYEFDLPPLGEQERIADLLWSVELHRRSVIESARTLSATRTEWFAETLIAGVESGWTRDSIRNLVISGPTNGKSGRANDEERGVPTLSISAIRDGLVRGGASVKYMDVAPGDVSNFVIQEDDVFVVRGNGNKQLTGRAGLARGGLPPGCVYPDLLIRLRFDDARLDPAFAVEQWNSSAHAELVQRAKSTNGIWKINGQDIKSHSLVVPPPAAQASMLGQIEHFARAESVIRSEADALGALRSSILSSIFGGN